MRPLCLAAIVAAVLGQILIAAAPVAAAPRRAVRVETTPSGATVYLGDKESGARGDTPLDLSLPPGEHTLILELEGFLPRFEVIRVEAARGAEARRPQVVSFALEPAVGTVVIEGDGLPKGARVLIDGEERGSPPVRVDVEPGAHQVEVLADGIPPFETWVEVSGGAEIKVSVPVPDAAPAGGGGAAPADEPRVEARAPETPSASGPRRHRYATVGAGYEVGWRRFRYADPRTSNAQPFDADNAGLVSTWIELHPHRALRGARAFWPLSVVAGYRHGLPLETALVGSDPVDARWRTADASLRWRVGLGRWAGVDLDAGWARTQFTFRDDAGDEVEQVPDVDYQALRLGVRAAGRAGPVEAWLGAENQIVMTGGLVEDRFRAAEVDGYGLRAGVEARVWPLVARLEAVWMHYGWVFGSQVGDDFQAAGADDDLYGITVSVGAGY